jgi:hypothetical protein
MKCYSRITLGPYKETYCQLEIGHAGEHSIGEVTANPSPAHGRCPSLSGTVQCGLLEGHWGNHWNQTASRGWLPK